MAEMLHMSRAGIQGPMLSAPPAQHAVVTHAEPAYAAWVPGSPNPHLGFAIDPGVRHQQVAPFRGAAEAAATQLGDEHVGRRQTRTPTGVAAPYQKAAAQHAAERALRPWAPMAPGLGERVGAPQLLPQQPQQHAAAQQGTVPAAAAAYGRPDAPSLYDLPGEAQAAAVGRAAAGVTRAGQGQGTSPGAYAPRQGAPVRELWAVNLNQPQRHCTACRGDHDPAKVSNPSWQPYSPLIRLQNLQLLNTKFKRALFKGMLCCKLSDAYWEPVAWLTHPKAMSAEAFGAQLALLVDGMREGHEPYRYLATQAAQRFLACPGRGADVAAAAPRLVSAIKLCLGTMQEALVGGMALFVQRLLRSDPRVGPALAPYYRHFLPTLAVFKDIKVSMHLPAPFCVPPTGSFGGRHPPAEAGGRSCGVCGCPVDKAHDAAAARQAAAAALAANATRADDPNAQQPPERSGNGSPLAGRFCKRYTLSAVVDETLCLMVEAGGRLGERIVRSYIPTFNYFNPREQPPTVEETLRRNGSSSSIAGLSGAVQQLGQRPASARPASRGGEQGSGPGPRPASSAGQVGAVRGPSRGKEEGAGGGGGGGGQQRRRGREAPRPVWQPGGGPTASAAVDLSRWDGIAFVDAQQADAASPGWDEDGNAGGGAGKAPNSARLSITTPVPIFDSPHDPLYRGLEQKWQQVAQAARRSVSYNKAAGKGGGGGSMGTVRRGGAGGAGGGVATSVNINSAVRYADTPAGLRHVF